MKAKTKTIISTVIIVLPVYELIKTIARILLQY